MELIKKTSRKTVGNGPLYTMHGMFKCGYCGKIVEKALSPGKRQKSCGCMNGVNFYRHQYELKMKESNQ